MCGGELTLVYADNYPVFAVTGTGQPSGDAVLRERMATLANDVSAVSAVVGLEGHTQGCTRLRHGTPDQGG